MFSRRLEWPAPHNRLTHLLHSRRDQGRTILDLTESNPTRVGLDYPVEAISAALADPRSAVYEPDPRGLAPARAAVAAYYARRRLTAPPERIVLTASTSEAYALLLKMLADPGDRILVPRPSYPLFDYLAALESVRVSSYPSVQDAGWRIDLRALERKAAGEGAEPTGEGSKTAGEGAGAPRAIVVVSPNNPTGSALRERERAALESICTRSRSAIIADEVFFDYLVRGRDEGDRIVSMLSPAGRESALRPLTFTLGGLSKACGMPQMKLGWIVVGGPEEEVREAIDRLELIADTYLSVGTPVQRAAPRLLDLGEAIQEQIRRRVQENRAALAGLIGPGSPCRLLGADGGWFAIVQVPAILPEEELVLKLLEEDDTLVHPGYFFDFPTEAHLVLSLLSDPATFGEGARRTLTRVERL